MHKTTGSMSAVLMVTLLSGCSGGDPAQPAVDATEPPAAEAREETVFDPMVGTIDRAKGVESTTAGRMDELNKQLEGAE